MSFKVSNFTGNDDILITESEGPFSIAEYKRDLSVSPYNAITEYFNSQMNIHRRQLICELRKTESGITLQAGSMQWMLGNVKATTGIKGAGDIISKAFKGAVTKESMVKPEYVGNGILVTEPTYKHLIIINVDDWNGSVVLDDGLFLACESNLKQSIVMRSNFSSTMAGGEGLFNLCLNGSGYACVESPCPQEEMITIDLNNDVIKIDGNMAIAWSSSLEFTVERSGKTLLGSVASGEGLVNTYRGTGRILMTPVMGKTGSSLLGTMVNA